jgi:hypothetical protein
MEPGSFRAKSLPTLHGRARVSVPPTHYKDISGHMTGDVQKSYTQFRKLETSQNQANNFQEVPMKNQRRGYSAEIEVNLLKELLQKHLLVRPLKHPIYNTLHD